MAKKPLRSKMFTYKGYKYYFELNSEITYVSVEVYFISPKHQPYEDYGDAKTRKKRPTDYCTSESIHHKRFAASPSEPESMEDYLIRLHKNCRKTIDQTIEFEKKLNLPVFELAAAVDVK